MRKVIARVTALQRRWATCPLKRLCTLLVIVSKYSNGYEQTWLWYTRTTCWLFCFLYLQALVSQKNSTEFTTHFYLYDVKAFLPRGLNCILDIIALIDPLNLSHWFLYFWTNKFIFFLFCIWRKELTSVRIRDLKHFLKLQCCISTDKGLLQWLEKKQSHLTV